MAVKKKLTAVLAGCGGISKTWLDSARRLGSIQIVGFVDVREEAARARKEEYGLKSAIADSDLRAVLRRTRPDAVFDCTVPEAHVRVTLEAFRHGCHVLGEKPMADSMENAWRMIAAAQRARRVYAVIQNRRYDPRIRALRRFLAAGRIGRPTTVHCDFFVGPHFGGFREKMRHVLLLDMAIHTFDAARFLSGSDPVTVYCRDWNPCGSWFADGASAAAIFEMTRGIVYNYRGSWCADGLPTTWQSSWRIIGDKGTVLWDGVDEFRAQVLEPRKGFVHSVRDIEVRVPRSAGPEGHMGNIAEFVRCVQTGQTPETICTDNVKSLAMIFGAIESSETGKLVRIRD